MKIYLDQAYGSMKASVGYEVLEEGKDFYLLKNQMYVPKLLAKTTPPKQDNFVYEHYKDEEY